MLQGKLDQPISSPPSPRELNNADMAQHLSQNINTLREEVYKLRAQLLSAQAERKLLFFVVLLVYLNHWKIAIILKPASVYRFLISCL